MKATIDVPDEVIARGEEFVRIYRDNFQHGHGFALMLAMQQAPGHAGTDKTFLQGRMNNQDLDRMAPVNAKKMLEKTRAAGIDISGKVYVSSMARPGLGVATPEAWVSGVDDVTRFAKARGLGVSGAKTVKEVEFDPPKVNKKPRLAPDIVEGHIQRMIAKDPGLASKDKRELAEAVIDKHAPKYKGK